MNELLQKHGCSNVFSMPEGLKELMADISREVLRDQPPDIFDYIASYLSVLLITREHGILAVKILDDLCDCRPSVSEHLMQLGMDKGEAVLVSQVIKEEVEGFEPEEGKEKIKEARILKKVLARVTLEEAMAANVCQVARNAYRDYWYRKKVVEQSLKLVQDEPWQIAAQRTLELYKRTRPSFNELTRATQKIQAAYRGYYVRRNMLSHFTPKKQKKAKVDLPGPPADVAGSREINLGPIITVNVREEDTSKEFTEVMGQSLHLGYDPAKTITHVETASAEPNQRPSVGTTDKGVAASTTKKATFKSIDDLEPEIDYPDLPIGDYPVLAERKGSFLEPDEQDKPDTAGDIVSFAEKEVHPAVEAEIPEELPLAESDAGQEDSQEVPEDIPNSSDYADSSDYYDSAEEADFGAPLVSVQTSAAVTDVDTATEGEEEKEEEEED